MALYMVLERFRNSDATPVYRRFRERGRMAPEGLNYISSWVTDDLLTCYQVMETTDRALLEDWMSHWSVIRGMSETSLLLHDSHDSTRVRIDSCRLSASRKGKRKRYWIRLYGTIDARPNKREASAKSSGSTGATSRRMETGYGR